MANQTVFKQNANRTESGEAFLTYFIGIWDQLRILSVPIGRQAHWSAATFVLNIDIWYISYMVYPVKKQQRNWLIHMKDSNYNFETNQWTSGGIPIDSSKWKNISSPYNEGKRYFPIMNDRLIWRMWNPANIGERYLWSYGPYHKDRYDSDKFYFTTQHNFVFEGGHNFTTQHNSFSSLFYNSA